MSLFPNNKWKTIHLMTLIWISEKKKKKTWFIINGRTYVPFWKSQKVSFLEIDIFPGVFPTLLKFDSFPTLLYKNLPRLME